jgi:hypothetical protein
MIAPSVVDRGIEPRSGETKDYEICICCFSAKHVAFLDYSKDLLAQNQDNVSEWNNMSARRLFHDELTLLNLTINHLF